MNSWSVRVFGNSVDVWNNTKYSPMKIQPYSSVVSLYLDRSSCAKYTHIDRNFPDYSHLIVENRNSLLADFWLISMSQVTTWIVDNVEMFEYWKECWLPSFPRTQKRAAQILSDGKVWSDYLFWLDVNNADLSNTNRFNMIEGFDRFLCFLYGIFERVK